MNPALNSAPAHPASTAESSGSLVSSRHGGMRVDSATAMTVIGACWVVLGGLVAAVTAPLELAHGSWVAAYLVLVGGVAQFAMGHARARHPRPRQSTAWGWVQIGAWNLGGALVIAGTLASEPLVVDVASVLLVAALAIALHACLVPARPTGRQMALWRDWAYRSLLLVVAVSIPVGVVLSHLRHS